MKKHLRPISLRKRRSTHGFLVRMRTRGGRKTLNRRRQKSRWQLIPV
ncbi:MAG: 50S ribosomal protein L34 [Candidatus Omnitrophica bacterium]|nr:50S ribosomal protein L34 [Candidatus Omnitrophota bacterium]